MDSLQEDIQCNICYKPFNGEESIVSILCPNLHYGCKECVNFTFVFQKCKKQYIKCPFCKVECKFTDIRSSKIAGKMSRLALELKSKETQFRNHIKAFNKNANQIQETIQQNIAYLSGIILKIKQNQNHAIPSELINNLEKILAKNKMYLTNILTLSEQLKKLPQSSRLQLLQSQKSNIIIKISELQKSVLKTQKLLEQSLEENIKLNMENTERQKQMRQIEEWRFDMERRNSPINQLYRDKEQQMMKSEGEIQWALWMSFQEREGLFIQ